MSALIGQVLGLFLVISSFAYLTNPHHCKKIIHDIIDSPGLYALAGSFALIIGLIIVLSHNIWEGWPILITVVGWIILIKGVFITFFAKSMKHFAKRLIKKHMMTWLGFAGIVLGIFISYFGFHAK